MKKALTFLLAALLLGLVACNGEAPASSSVVEESSAPVSQSAAVSKAEPEPPPPHDNDNTLQAMASCFALESAPLVLAETFPGDAGGEGKNGCYSPLSLYILLAMAAPGASGQTQAELLDALGAGEIGVEGLTTEVAALMDELPFLQLSPAEMDFSPLPDEEPVEEEAAEVETARLDLANSLWLKEGGAFRQPYADLVQGSFGAELYTVPMPGEGTEQQMVGWAQEKTNNLVSPDIQLDTTSQLILMNTLYYKATWLEQFDPEDTRVDSFHLAGGGTVNCEYMQDRFYYAGFDGNGYMAGQLPLYGDGIMTLVLPKFSTGCGYDLKGAMGAMGVERAFDENNAEFFDMAENDINGNLYVSKLVQDTKIMVDEVGVEAAAVTRMEMNATGLYEESVLLYLTRPFLYFISLRDYPTAPLFIGVVHNPTVE